MRNDCIKYIKKIKGKECETSKLIPSLRGAAGWGQGDVPGWVLLQSTVLQGWHGAFLPRAGQIWLISMQESSLPPIPEHCMC